MLEAPELRKIAEGLHVDPEEMDEILAQGATLPAIFYTSPEIARLEDELIWRRMWHPLAVEPELRRVGDFVTGTISGFDFKVPVVVVRDEEMQLRAYINVCRHRAHFVAVGCGNRKTLQCIYHGWTYGLNGSLRNVPRSEEGLPGGVPFDELGLYPLPIDTWDGYVFVSLDPVESLMSFLGEFPQVMEEVGRKSPFSAENADPDWEYVREVRPTFRIEANWKAMIENDIECYHCPTTHTHSFSDMYKVDNKNYTFHNFDKGVYHSAFYQDIFATRFGLDDPERKPDYVFTKLWPNLSIGGGARGGKAGFGTRVPDGVHACIGEGIQYKLPDAAEYDIDEELQADFDEKWRMTADEDRDAAARVQTGLKSNMYKWGYTLPISEMNMRHFYAYVWNQLSPAFR